MAWIYQRCFFPYHIFLSISVFWTLFSVCHSTVNIKKNMEFNGRISQALSKGDLQKAALFWKNFPAVPWMILVKFCGPELSCMALLNQQWIWDVQNFPGAYFLKFGYCGVRGKWLVGPVAVTWGKHRERGANRGGEREHEEKRESEGNVFWHNSSDII